MRKEVVITYTETIKKIGQKVFYTKSSIKIYQEKKKKM